MHQARGTKKEIQEYNSKLILMKKDFDDLTYEEKKTVFSIMCTHNRYKPKPVYIGIFVSPITIFQSNINTERP